MSFDKKAWRKEYNATRNNWDYKSYEKTISGFLMRLYRNMQSRVAGVDKKKAHLYLGKPLLAREDFYQWALGSPEFYKLFGEYKISGYERKLCPSVDRKESDKGYELSNMEWVTMSENSRRGAVSRHNLNKGVAIV